MTDLVADSWHLAEVMMSMLAEVMMSMLAEVMMAMLWFC